MKLQAKFLIPVIAVLVLAFVSLGFISISFTRNTVMGVLDSQMKSVADSAVHQIESSDEISAIVLELMDQAHIHMAQALAQMVAEDPSKLETDKMTELTKLLGVDEVHITDENGVLLWGNVPDFFGLDFYAGDQTRPLTTIIDDPTLVIAQEPMPRATDGMMFQYINVSRADQKGIVQVGVSMQRIDDIKASMSAQKALEGSVIGQNGGVFVLDSNNTVVADSTGAQLDATVSDAWVDQMRTAKQGNLDIDWKGSPSRAYFETSGDFLVVGYIPNSELEGYSSAAVRNIVPVAAGATVLVVIIVILFSSWVARKVYWYEGILDSVPYPLSVTDKNRNWTFVNKEIENIVGKSRRELIGTPCSQWGTSICGTLDCGISKLYEGKAETEYEENGKDYKVDTGYLNNSGGHHIGHVEIMQDITTLREEQKAQEALVDNISVVSGGFVSASQQVSDGAAALAQATTEQASSVQELQDEIHKVAAKAVENTQKAGEAAELANTIIESAQKGSHQMGEMTAAVNDINEASQSISKVIKVIDDIAFQTNILALNAAVEAARAGAHGKGFAVVAGEVRNLAAKSADAAKDTSALIESSIEKTKLGARIAAETAASLVDIVRGIEKSSAMIDDIAKSSKEQNAGTDQINEGISQVAEVVQQNSATAEESAAAAEELRAQSAELSRLLEDFRLEEQRREIQEESQRYLN